MIISKERRISHAYNNKRRKFKKERTSITIPFMIDFDIKSRENRLLQLTRFEYANVDIIL